MVRVLINVPKQVKRGEPFDVKLLISHPMESGQRHDDMGQPIPRDIINSFVYLQRRRRAARRPVPRDRRQSVPVIRGGGAGERHACDDLH